MANKRESLAPIDQTFFVKKFIRCAAILLGSFIAAGVVIEIGFRGMGI